MSDLIRRYEEVRQYCLQNANLHPDSKETCHQALKFARDVSGLSFSMAGLLDDMAIALNHPQQEQKE